MSIMVDAKSTFPKLKYSQNQLADFLCTIWPDKKNHLLKFAKNVLVEERAFCMPLEEIMKLKTFAQRNQLWQEHSTKLAKDSIEQLLSNNGLTPDDIDMFVTTSVTGISIPSIDTILMNELKFNPNTKRLPLFGFGCLGGLASLNRAHEYLDAHPTKTILITAVELCSLTFQIDDFNISNLIGSSLFGDGAASVLMVGKDHPLAKKGKFKLIDYESYFYENTQKTMGWNIKDSGFQLILSGSVSDVVMENIPKNLGTLIDRNRIKDEDLKFSISHPGGPKVLQSLAEAINRDDDFFSHSWESLKQHGNLSSVSILNVLEREINSDQGSSGDLGVMAAMGPGFNSELSIIERL